MAWWLSAGQQPQTSTPPVNPPFTTRQPSTPTNPSGGRKTPRRSRLLPQAIPKPGISVRTALDRRPRKRPPSTRVPAAAATPRGDLVTAGPIAIAEATTPTQLWQQHEASTISTGSAAAAPIATRAVPGIAVLIWATIPPSTRPPRQLRQLPSFAESVLPSDGTPTLAHELTPPRLRIHHRRSATTLLRRPSEAQAEPPRARAATPATTIANRHTPGRSRRI